MQTRKQLSFDLDTKQLKKYYPKRNWRKAYDDIKDFMLKNNFTWIQGLVYVTKENCQIIRIRKIIKQLLKQNPYLNVCMRDCVVTNIGKAHNLNNMFDKDMKIKKRSIHLDR